MSIATVVEHIGTDVKDVAEDVLHVGDAIVEVFAQVKQLAPAFKADIATLIADVEPIVAALTPVIAAGGTNIGIDLAALAPVEADLRKLVADFVSFLPTLKAAIADAKTDAAAIKPAKTYA